MFPNKGKVFPKKGKVLPDAGGEADRHAIYAATIARALREEFGRASNATKTVMRWTGASERTVKNWFAGSNGPTGGHLVALLQHSDIVLDALVKVAGRRPVITSAKLAALSDALTNALRLVDDQAGLEGR